MSTLRHALFAAAAIATLPSIHPSAYAASAAAAKARLGSLLPAPAPLQLLGVAQASQPVEFDVVLPLSNGAALDQLLVQLNASTSPQYHQWLTPNAFAARFGPARPLVNQVATQLRLFGLTVTSQNRSLHVTGTAAQVKVAFGVSLQLASDVHGRLRLVAVTPLTLPVSLANTGLLVPAFHPGKTDANPLIRRAASGYANRSTGGYGSSANGSYTYLFNDLKQAYRYPSYQVVPGSKNASGHLDGTGATLAVIMSSDVVDSDVAALFNSEKFTANSGQVAPAIFARRPVDGGPTSTTDPTSAEEATLDVEQVLGGAPGAHVILYDTPDLSDQSLVSALVAVDNDNNADVVSMSYGQCELYYTAAYNNGIDQTAVLQLYSELYKQGNAQGITFIGASGDSGGLGCMSPDYFSGSSGSFVAGVSVPAADPSVTSVGGTNLVTARAQGGLDSSYVGENAYADLEAPLDPFDTGAVVAGGVFGAGGGVSTLFAKPDYQNLVNTGSISFRTVPDIGMEVGGCPDDGSGTCDSVGTLPGDTGDRSGVAIVFNGAPDSIIGTSAAAPELASAVALLVQLQGRQGNLNPYLYTLAQRQAGGAGAAYFHQNIPGNNGVTANSGTYNYTVGNGTPNVAALLGLANGPLAGAPGTPSNP